MRPKILLVGLHIPNMGFSRVMQHIVRAAIVHYEVHFIGLGYDGVVQKMNDYTLYPSQQEQNRDVLGIQQFQRLLNQLQPEVCFILHDLQWMRYYAPILATYDAPITAITYLPVDGYLNAHNKHLAAPLAVFDYCIFYTKFGEEMIVPHIPHGEQKTTTSVIPHGVDLTTFYPLDTNPSIRRQKARSLLFPEQPELNDAFIVLNANRPWPRKRIDLTIKGFAKFAKDKPKNVKLYLHHARTNEVERAQIMALIYEEKIYGRLLINDVEADLTNEQLNYLYNACNIGLNTTMGEGWGLINMEHAATGAAQILPTQPVLKEIWKDNAVFMNTSNRTKVWFAPLEMESTTIDEVAAALETIYQNADYRSNIEEKGAHHIQQATFQWKQIEQQWTNLFSQLKNHPICNSAQTH